MDAGEGWGVGDGVASADKRFAAAIVAFKKATASIDSALDALILLHVACSFSHMDVLPVIEKANSFKTVIHFPSVKADTTLLLEAATSARMISRSRRSPVACKQQSDAAAKAAAVSRRS